MQREPAGVETVVAEVQQGRGDYSQDEEDEFENVKERISSVIDDSPSMGQGVHRQVMIAFEEP